MDLVIFVGLPAAGKSTFFSQRFRLTHDLVSKDLLPNVRDKNERQQRLLSQALARGRSVVVDNTNSTVADRRPLIGLAKPLGARIVGYYFEPEPRACLARNKERPDKARVPAVAIFATAKRLQPPAYSEGFDELYRVKATPELNFEVTPIQVEGSHV